MASIPCPTPTRLTATGHLPVKVRNRHRVLRAAQTLISEEGLEALTMRRIALEADMSVASLYNLIGNRKDIVRSLGSHLLAEQDEVLLQVRADDPYERAQRILLAVVDLVINECPKPLALALLSDITAFTTDLRPNIQPTPMLAEAIQAMVANKTLSDVLSVNLIAKQVWYSHNGFLRQWAASWLNERELRAAVLHNLDLCLLAIATPKGRQLIIDHARTLEDDLRKI